MSQSSVSDLEFRAAFEAGAFPVAEFDHRAHLRLAYVYLVEGEPESALASMRSALAAFLARDGIDPAKYHETITRAWVLAVRHFIAKAPDTASFAELAERQPQMLDSRIMLTHYSCDRLFSAEARAEFVPPDIDPIPDYR
jgi:hypothetical protein